MITTNFNHIHLGLDLPECALCSTGSIDMKHFDIPPSLISINLNNLEQFHTFLIPDKRTPYGLSHVQSNTP